MSVSDQMRSGPLLDGQRYNAVAKLLHWVIVVLIIMQFVTKWVPAQAFGASKGQLNAWHLAVGPTVLALMLLRLAWRLTHRVPPPPTDLPPSLRLLSRATHWTFYGLLIVLPVLGWMAASGYGATPTLAGLIPLPSIFPHDKAAAEVVGSVHGALALLLLAIIALHVAGALYHAVVKRDGVVRRILPGT